MTWKFLLPCLVYNKMPNKPFLCHHVIASTRSGFFTCGLQLAFLGTLRRNLQHPPTIAMMVQASEYCWERVSRVDPIGARL